MGGSDDPSNLIELTIEQHADAHRVLYEEHGNRQDYVAYKSLLQQMEHEERQEILSSIGGVNNKGNPKSTEHKAKIRAKRSEQVITEETKKKISTSMKANSNSKNHMSDEYKRKQSLAMKEAWAKRKAPKL